MAVYNALEVSFPMEELDANEHAKHIVEIRPNFGGLFSLKAHDRWSLTYLTSCCARQAVGVPTRLNCFGCQQSVPEINYGTFDFREWKTKSERVLGPFVENSDFDLLEAIIVKEQFIDDVLTLMVTIRAAARKRGEGLKPGPFTGDPYEHKLALKNHFSELHGTMKHSERIILSERA